MTKILRSELARLSHEEIVEFLCGALRESLTAEAPFYSSMLSDGTLIWHVDKAVIQLEKLASSRPLPVSQETKK